MRDRAPFGAWEDAFYVMGSTASLRRPSSKSDPLRKEVIQPQVLLRLPCYDLVPITELAVDASLLDGWVGGFGHSRLSWLDGRCVQGSGTYSPLRS